MPYLFIENDSNDGNVHPEIIELRKTTISMSVSFFVAVVIVAVGRGRRGVIMQMEWDTRKYFRSDGNGCGVERQPLTQLAPASFQLPAPCPHRRPNHSFAGSK